MKIPSLARHEKTSRESDQQEAYEKLYWELAWKISNTDSGYYFRNQLDSKSKHDVALAAWQEALLRLSEDNL